MRNKRDLSSGAWAMVGWYAMSKVGEWLVTQVTNHVAVEQMVWYEWVIVSIGVVMAVCAIICGAATVLGMFDKN